jgi:hypothetical protein
MTDNYLQIYGQHIQRDSCGTSASLKQLIDSGRPPEKNRHEIGTATGISLWILASIFERKFAAGDVSAATCGTTLDSPNNGYLEPNDRLESASANYSWTALMPSSRGFVMCAGKRHIRYIRRNIYLLRNLWGSRLPFAVAHCGELSDAYEQMLHRLDPTIKFINLCETDTIFGLPLYKAQKVLQGFYC